MAESRTNEARQPSQKPEPGFLAKVFWVWPWGLVGIILSSLMISLFIEYIGITFFWSEAGASHSETVMTTELGWLSTEFTRSLMLSEPSVTVVHWITTAYQWAFIDSGITEWIQSQYHAQMHSNNSITRGISSFSSDLVGYLHEYLLATIWISVITLVRVTILVLSVPLFVMVMLVALVEGLGRRDLRRYGAGYESSFIYHRAKKLIKPAAVIPAMIYLSWPTAVYPNFLILPAALLCGLAVSITVATFKKYL